jgi:hypothetical protein
MAETVSGSCPILGSGISDINSLVLLDDFGCFYLFIYSFIHSIICSLFKEATSNSSYIALNDLMTVNI